MSNNAEQYTVKTPEECFHKHYNIWSGNDGTLKDAMINAIKEYSSEPIKENERLREENKLYREALTGIALDIDSVLSKFQPKKDESNDEPIKRG